MEPQTPDRETLQNLLDAGCDEDTVQCFCALEACNGSQIQKKQARLLCSHRKKLLCELHACQERLDCLDYLLYKLRHGGQKN